MKKLKQNVFHNVDSLDDLATLYDVDDLLDSDFYLMSGESLLDIVNEMSYHGFNKKEIIQRTKIDGFGYSQWTIYQLKNDGMFVLIDEFV